MRVARGGLSNRLLSSYSTSTSGAAKKAHPSCDSNEAKVAKSLACTRAAPRATPSREDLAAQAEEGEEALPLLVDSWCLLTP
jgi:hypothetical protein